MSDEYPPYINAQDGIVEGTLVRYSKGPNKFDPENDVPIAVLDVDGDVRSLWLNTFVLRSKFADLKPVAGERVRVEYLGKREGANGEYHNFAVEMPDRPPYEPDWDAIGANAESWG